MGQTVPTWATIGLMDEMGRTGQNKEIGGKPGPTGLNEAKEGYYGSNGGNSQMGQNRG